MNVGEVQNETKQTIRYAYLHDPMEPSRIIAIARTIDVTNEGNVLRYGIAINRRTKDGWTPQDVFDKKMARTISEGRMKCVNRHIVKGDGLAGLFTLPEDKTEGSYRALLAHLVRTNPSVYIRRAAQERLSLLNDSKT